MLAYHVRFHLSMFELNWLIYVVVHLVVLSSVCRNLVLTFHFSVQSTILVIPGRDLAEHEVLCVYVVILCLRNRIDVVFHL